ncbi:MAG: HemK2/MTQ2 family protein methyltransferase [Nanoarchaeota archaeon]
MSIYTPSDDSFLLQEIILSYIKNNKKSPRTLAPTSQQAAGYFLSLQMGTTKNHCKQGGIKHMWSNKNKTLKILDMGAGSGILAQTFQEHNYKNILAVDINPEAVRHLKKLKIKAIQSDLFSNLQKKKFDIIVFNTPYLPEDKREPLDSKMQTTAGKKGYELILKFLEQAQNHLTKKGKILLLFSSLSKPSIILKKARELNYNYEIKGKKRLFFEELFVYELLKK